MKIAIHPSGTIYSDRWIKYCKETNIPYKIVDCYDSDIIEHLSDCDALMWHYYHKGYRDILAARQILYALETSGKKVYPDFRTGWHFDDKVGQKYLLEAVGAPLVPSFVFYSKADALKWISKASFPKVFKLRRGSGSENVRLVKCHREAKRLINKGFSKGFRQYEPMIGLRERWRMSKLGGLNIKDLMEGIGRLFIKTNFEKIVGNERGYVYFQDFVEGCTFDIRATIIGSKCFAFKRLVRENDFRASGSHSENMDHREIPLEVIRIAFQISQALRMQSVAFDFLITNEGKPVITEISYAFGWEDGDSKGYWDSNLEYYPEEFDPFGLMVENLINRIKGDK